VNKDIHCDFQVVELTSSDEKIPTKGWPRTSLNLLKKLMLKVRLTGLLVAVVLNPSERLASQPSCRTWICSIIGGQCVRPILYVVPLS